MDLRERCYDALLRSAIYPLYFSLFYAYHTIDSRECRLADTLDEDLLRLSEELIYEVLGDEEWTDDIDHVDICCYLRGCCFDRFKDYEAALRAMSDS